MYNLYLMDQNKLLDYHMEMGMLLSMVKVVGVLLLQGLQITQLTTLFEEIHLLLNWQPLLLMRLLVVLLTLQVLVEVRLMC